jgi:hypothetical protein
MAAFGRKMMKLVSTCADRRVVIAALLVAVALPLQMRGDTFTKPTEEELKVTSVPGYPGAPAVVLFQELITKDDLHVQQYYYRIKILTEDGKKYANVELPFFSSQGDGVYEGNENDMADIVGRTIHPDGTVIPFTGKPYLKTIEKEQGYKYQERIFTLPDVEVGSIIEYRYNLRYNDHVYESPNWYIQRELFVRAAHYAWYPTAREMMDTEVNAPVTTISWFPILPAGAQIEHHETPGRDSIGDLHRIYELNVKDVPPTDNEEYMPPIESFSYRVLFNYTAYRGGEDFWKSKGKTWSKHADSFIGPSSELKAATQAIIAGATTDDQKLHKIYAAVMALDNTDFSRAHEHQEDKAAGLGKVNNAGDVLAHKRGSGTEITDLFIGMARAAGMKAYLMTVTDRNNSLFAVGWLNFRQLNSVLAIVNVGGKEMYFDPGSRYCGYGQLVWGDTNASGLRQVDGGTAIASTPGESYSANATGRAANLTMDEHGEITGKINAEFSGNTALLWRQRALRGDEESIRHGLRTSMEENLPKTLQVKINSIKNLDDYEKPLQVEYAVTGTLGTTTGKRFVLPVDLFHTQSRATFPQEKRTQAVYFHFPQITKEAIRVNFPKELSIEAAPTSSRLDIKDKAMYTMDVTPAPTSITVRRTFAFNEILVKKEAYPELRSFYSQFESKDQESVVLKQALATAAPAGN